MEGQKNAETSRMDSYNTQLVILKARRIKMKIYGLIFEKRTKFDSVSLNLKMKIHTTYSSNLYKLEKKYSF